jgi:hypothetical protein
MYTSAFSREKTGQEARKNGRIQKKERLVVQQGRVSKGVQVLTSVRALESAENG